MVKEDYKKYPLRELFRHLVSLNSVDNDKVAELYFHALLGAMLKNVRIIKGGSSFIDLRIPIVWIQNSRTGKGALNKTLHSIAGKLGLNVTTTTEVTTAGMVGKIDDKAEEYNTKYGLSPEIPFVEIKNKMYEYRDPVVRGDLGNYDIIIIDEAKILLEPTKYTEQLLTVLQPVMDSPGWVRKKLSSRYAVEYGCSPTIIATTYFFNSIKDVIANQGFFQRVAFYIRDLDVETILNMRNEAMQIAQKGSVDKYQKLEKIFIERMLTEVNTEEQEIFIHPETFPVLEKLRKSFFEKIQKSLTGAELRAALSFSNTIEELVLKISGHYAVIRGEKEIRTNVVLISYKFVKNVISTILDKMEIEEDKNKSRHIDTIKRVYNDCPQPITKTAFYAVLQKRLKIGKNKAGKIVNRLIRENYLYEEKGEKNTQYLKIR